MLLDRHARLVPAVRVGLLGNRAHVALRGHAEGRDRGLHDERPCQHGNPAL